MARRKYPGGRLLRKKRLLKKSLKWLQSLMDRRKIYTGEVRF